MADLDQTAWCPYWRCHTERTFERSVERDESGTPVAVSYECESCGRSYEWAMETLQENYSEDPENWLTTGGRYYG